MRFRASCRQLPLLIFYVFEYLANDSDSFYVFEHLVNGFRVWGLGLGFRVGFEGSGKAKALNNYLFGLLSCLGKNKSLLVIFCNSPVGI